MFYISEVSTHSRPKAAGKANVAARHGEMFQHTAARRRLDVNKKMVLRALCFNTQPPEGGWEYLYSRYTITVEFQHTAARRRLARAFKDNIYFSDVSTHSRPKAAGSVHQFHDVFLYGFNTQPPEGGWGLRRWDTPK